METRYLVVLCTGGPDHPHRLFQSEGSAVAYAQSDVALAVPECERLLWVNDGPDPVLFVKVARFIGGVLDGVVYAREVDAPVDAGRSHEGAWPAGVTAH